MSEVEVRDDQVFLYNSEGHATPMSPAQALRLARELTRAADTLLDRSSDPTFTGGGSMEGAMPHSEQCMSTRPFDDPDQCQQPSGHRGPHRAGLGTEVWRDAQTRSILDRSPREDGRRPDWDSLTGDQKVQARLSGEEFVPLTLEQRVERLERHIVEIESRPNPYDVIRGMDGR